MKVSAQEIYFLYRRSQRVDPSMEDDTQESKETDAIFDKLCRQLFDKSLVALLDEVKVIKKFLNFQKDASP